MNSHIAYLRGRLPSLSAALVACFLTSGCMLPIPHSKDVGPVVVIKQTDIGVMTQQEVLARWGKPNATLEQERAVAYSWVHEGFKICGSSGASPGSRIGCSEPHMDYHLTLVQFDQSGCVERAEEPPDPPHIYADIVRTLREWTYRATIKVGITTQDEIAARLGKPDIVFEGNHIYLYGNLPDDYVLLVKFDDSNRVVRSERVLSSRRQRRNYPQFVSDWESGKL